MVEIKLDQLEYKYLCSASFLPYKIRNLLRSCKQQQELYALKITEDLADKIRDLCGEQLQIVGFDEKYELSEEGKILDSLVDKFFVEQIDDQAKRQILTSFLENLQSISDKTYQERIWVRAEGPECHDIDDAIGDFFDDGEPIIERYRDFAITEKQHTILINFREKLRAFADAFDIYHPNKSTEKLIHQAQWEEIRNLAKGVLRAFDSEKRKVDSDEFLKSMLAALLGMYSERNQPITWELREAPEENHFERVMHDFFEFCDPLLDKYEEHGVTEAQYQALKKLGEALKAFSDEHDCPEGYLDSPEWERIREMVDETMKVFHFLD